jgi:hypothetical protein
MRINIDVTSQLEDILYNLICPALDTLHIRSISRRHHGILALPQNLLSLFLMRSSCTIQRFLLSGFSICDSSLVACLEELSSLTELDIYETHPTPHPLFFGSMTYDSRLAARSQSATLVPKLKVLRLSVDFGSEAEKENGRLFAMIQSRRNLTEGIDASQNMQRISLVSKLESVHLMSHRHFVAPEQLARMRELRDEGLDFQVTYDSRRLL